MITIDDGWRIARVSVEGHDLAGLLSGLGLTDSAERSAALLGSPAGDCVRQVPSLIAELLDSSKGDR